jgi:hypothetical protein
MSTDALFYCILASTALSFRSVYGLTQLQLGLCFLASGLGCLIGAATNGKRMNLNYAAMVTKMEDKRTKEFTEASEKGEVPVVDDTHRDLNDLSQFPIEQARMKTLRECTLSYVGERLETDARLNCSVVVGGTPHCYSHLRLESPTRRSPLRPHHLPSLQYVPSPIPTSSISLT